MNSIIPAVRLCKRIEAFINFFLYNRDIHSFPKCSQQIAKQQLFLEMNPDQLTSEQVGTQNIKTLPTPSGLIDTGCFF